MIWDQTCVREISRAADIKPGGLWVAYHCLKL